ncbi:MAG TPA: hypothetical protein ENH82_12610 [bacterium]|nr:hypothetical protein [bacterium]
MKILVFYVKINRTIIDENGRYLPYSIGRIGIYIYVLYIQPIIIFSLIFAWPTLSIKDRFKAAMISIPFQLAIVLVDIPFFVIIQREKDVSFIDYQPGLIRMLWFHFLDKGGRQFMAILAFMASIAPFRLINPKITKSGIGRNDTCPCDSGKKYKNCCLKK